MIDVRGRTDRPDTVLTVPTIRQIAAKAPPTPPTPGAGMQIAAWLPTGQFHRLFHGILVYEQANERRYFVPAGSVVWNRTARGWSSWITRSGSYKRFLQNRWWNETLVRNRALGRYYDIATPPLFHEAGVAYVDLYLDVAKRRGHTVVVDRDEWRGFVRRHPVAPELPLLLARATREARHYGPADWSQALDTMENECRRWVAQTVRILLADLGVTPTHRPLEAPVLAELLHRFAERTGAALSPRRYQRTPALELGRVLFQDITRPQGGPASGTRAVRTTLPSRPAHRRSNG